MPEHFVSHRWLSAYDICLSTNILMGDACVVFYGFLKTVDNKNSYDTVIEINNKREMRSESKDRINKVHKELTK